MVKKMRIKNENRIVVLVYSDSSRIRVLVVLGAFGEQEGDSRQNFNTKRKLEDHSHPNRTLLLPKVENLIVPNILYYL